ncbi:MLO-like protein 13 isoform X1 [Pistacia vera]|uniref:MLO-like protein 13 isoform X1 n=2 Tax=Pistacia vera TaxID=55513 RepID=UPI0012638B7B|nr:MLO-like protein 13 isoform X1 [Pistacia vera]
MAEESNSLEHTPTWVVAVVCFVIILISLCAERGLHKLGKWLKRNKQNALFEALQKLQEELMLLGFISLLLTVFQDAISHICMPTYLGSFMLPCKRHTVSHKKYSLGAVSARRQLLTTKSGSDHCLNKGKIPFLSMEALHQLHIFIFVLAVVHVIFCVTTMVLGGLKIRQWKHWEASVKRSAEAGTPKDTLKRHHITFFDARAIGYWRNAAVVSWMISFLKQFYGSVTKSDYVALRQGFIMTHLPRKPDFDFHGYMTRTLERDLRKVVGIRWHLWLFVVVFLLLNVAGWHTFFWLSFLPIVLLLLVGAKLEHIITRLAQEVKRKTEDQELGPVKPNSVKPSDDHFWFGRPGIVLDLIHFILFQNSFEIAFFFWILCLYGFESCIMEKLGYIIPRLIIGVIVQVLCSYSTLPLYALVAQMGSKFRFSEEMQSSLGDWASSVKIKVEASKRGSSDANGKQTQTQAQTHKMTQESYEIEEMVVIERAKTPITESSPVS